MQAGFGRPQSNAHQVCDSRQLKVASIPQHEERTFVRRQEIECSPHAIRRLDCVGNVGRGLPACGNEGRPPTCLARDIDSRVGDDASEPRTPHFGVSKPWKVAPSPERGLLEHVICLRIRTRDGDGDPECPPGLPFDEQPKGALVSGLGGVDKISKTCHITTLRRWEAVDSFPCATDAGGRRPALWEILCRGSTHAQRPTRLAEERVRAGWLRRDAKDGRVGAKGFPPATPTPQIVIPEAVARMLATVA